MPINCIKALYYIFSTHLFEQIYHNLLPFMYVTLARYLNLSFEALVISNFLCSIIFISAHISNNYIELFLFTFKSSNFYSCFYIHSIERCHGSQYIIELINLPHQSFLSLFFNKIYIFFIIYYNE